jgi:PAS domain S-box-containing protein
MKRSEPATTRIARWTFGIVLGTLGLAGGLWFWSIQSAIETGHWIEHTLVIQKELGALLSSVLDEGMEFRELALKPNERSRGRMEVAREASSAHLARIEALTVDNASQQRRLVDLRRTVDGRTAFAGELTAARKDGGVDAAHALLDSGVSAVRLQAVRAMIEAMNDEEDRLLGERTRREGSQIARAVEFGIAMCGVIVAAIGLGYILIRHAARARRATTEAIRASEERFRTLVDGVSDHALCLLDARGNVASWNAGAERLTQYSSAEIVGKHVSTFDPGADRAEGGLVVAAEKGRYAETAPRRRKDGTMFLADVVISALRNDDGILRGFAEVMRDLTERKSGEAALKRVEDQLRQAQKLEAIGSLAGGVAHDFNNLLSVILSYADLLIEDLPPDSAARADMGEIKKAGVRATVLTRQLLAFSRQQVLQPQVVDLNEIAAGVEAMLRRLLGEDVELALLTARTVGRVYADPGQVEQVIMNLVINARDAMPVGGKVSIETADIVLDDAYVAAHVGVIPGPYVMLAVTDTGTGMDAATRARIFEPFFTTKDKSKGTGLGLSTVYGIVQQSGGSIWVYSEPGKGTTFKVYFPRSALSADTRQTPLPSATTVRGTETILLVEDEEPVRVIVRTILRRNGYTVLEAENGGEAFLVSEQHTAAIHLMLTDVVMPRMSGRQLAERLAPLRPSMRVLYMSGYTQDTISHHGVLDSGIAFLEKPISPDALLRKVREVLDARSP